jgi:hypothetical protein
MNMEYNKKEWATGTTLGRRVYNFGYRMTGREFRGWKLLKSIAMQQKRDITETVYMWGNNSDPKHEMVRVSITERHDWKRAQESLHQNLTECMRPSIPRGAKKLAPLGDVNYAAGEPQTNIVGAITFTRGNVCVSVSTAGDKNVDVSELAGVLDRSLSEPPARVEAAKLMARPRAPKSVDVTARKSVVLVENLSNAVQRGGWLKILVPDGELHRKGDSLIYVSPETGKKRVSAFARVSS